MCPECQDRVIVGDIVVNHLMPVGEVQTCGRLVVKKRGSVIADVVRVGQGLEVQGSLSGNVDSDGPVIIGRFARWKGDCRAPSVEIRAGARITSGRFDVPFVR